MLERVVQYSVGKLGEGDGRTAYDNCQDNGTYC
jgi:hypothetical protein